MNSEVPDIAPAQGARLQEVIAGSPGIVPKLRRLGAFVWKLLFGAFLCSGMFGSLGPLGFIGAILAVGWTYRLMQRQALKIWWVRSPEWYDGVRFETLTSSDDDLRQHLHWPGWFRGESGRLSSLRANFSIGLRGVFNAYVLTILPGFRISAWASGAPLRGGCPRDTTGGALGPARIRKDRR